jgi:acetyl esterase/lipase
MDDVLERLDPEVAAGLADLPPMNFTSATLESRRSMAPPVPPVSTAVERRDVVVPAGEGSPEVTVRVHRPLAGSGDLPCIYWMHGGGYVIGSYANEDGRFDRWCQRLECVGVSVEYRLAPEHPFPAPLDDCYAGLRWVADHANELSIDATRIGVAGSSAGAGLAAAMALVARDRGDIALAFQLLHAPMLDDRQMTRSSKWQVPVWSPESNRFGWSCYLGDLYGSDKVPPYAAPARAQDLAGLPPTLISVGTADGFFDEDVAYAERLNRAGVPTDLRVYPGAPHGFDSVAPDAAVSRRAMQDLEEWLTRHMQPRQ